MIKRTLVRGERHHWWPQSLSQLWTNTDGLIHRIDVRGEISPSTPRRLARIKDGHNLIFENLSEWNQTIEGFFDSPDGKFPRVIHWLSELVDRHESHAINGNSESYCPHECDDSKFGDLTECLLSLVWRSPQFRYKIVKFAQELRGSLGRAEQDQLTVLNMMQSYERIVESTSSAGKVVLFFSNSREFIFGDGFYHNLTSISAHAVMTRILVPLTPGIAVLYTCPQAYTRDPRIVTRLADDLLIELVNQSVQTYSKDCLFFNSEPPELSDHFLANEHLEVLSPSPIDDLFWDIPGVISRGSRVLHELFRQSPIS